MLITEYREEVRTGRWTRPTRGVAPGNIQCNIVILPEHLAAGFAAWCAANSDVAPVLAQSETGNSKLPTLGVDIDIRTDVPKYRVYREGEPTAICTDLTEIWRPDLVTFAFGCSFSLEELLRIHGVPLRYESRGFRGAIYATTRQTVPAGGFSGPLVVSMRPIPVEAVDRAVSVSAKYPWLHGAPVHVGDPADLGIDLDKPLHTLDKVSIVAGEVPVFWACGVTAHLIMERAGAELAITHESAHMLITDLPINS